MAPSRFEIAYNKKIEKKRNLIHEALAELRKFAQSLNAGERLIVFGSAARGEALEHSDVDILVDVKDPMRASLLEVEFTNIFSSRGLELDARWVGYCTDEFIEQSQKDHVIMESRNAG